MYFIIWYILGLILIPLGCHIQGDDIYLMDVPSILFGAICGPIVLLALFPIPKNILLLKGKEKKCD
jgi:hypothetical protein